MTFDAGQRIFIEAEYRNAALRQGVADDAKTIEKLAQTGTQNLREVAKSSQVMAEALAKAQKAADNATASITRLDQRTSAFAGGGGRPGGAALAGGPGAGPTSSMAWAAAFGASLQATRQQIDDLGTRGAQALQTTEKSANATSAAIGGLAAKAGAFAAVYGMYQLGSAFRGDVADIRDQAEQLSVMEATMRRLGSSEGQIRGTQEALADMARDSKDLSELHGIFQGLLEVTGSWKNALVGTPLVQDIAAGSALSLAEAHRVVADALTGTLEPSVHFTANINRMIREGKPALEILREMEVVFGGLRVEMEQLGLGGAFARWWENSLGNPTMFGGLARGWSQLEDWMIGVLDPPPKIPAGWENGIMAKQGMRPGTTRVTEWLLTMGLDPLVPFDPPKDKPKRTRPPRYDGPVPGFNREWDPEWYQSPSVRGYQPGRGGVPGWALTMPAQAGWSDRWGYQPSRGRVPGWASNMPMQTEGWAEEWDKILEKRREFEEGMRRQNAMHQEMVRSLQMGFESAFAGALISGQEFVNRLKAYMQQELITFAVGSALNAIFPGAGATTGILGNIFGGGSGSSSSSSALNPPLATRGIANATARGRAYRALRG